MRERQLPLGQVLLLLVAIVGILIVLVTRPKPLETLSLAFIVKSGQYQYSGTLFRIDADGSHLQQLADHVRGSFAPNWSPDGEKLLYVSDESDLWVIDADGKNQRRLTQGANISYQPAWSPDSKNIVFISNNDIAMMNLDGSMMRQITNQGNYETGRQDFGYTNVSWSPDGKYIAFEGYHRPTQNGDIFIVNALCADAASCINLFPINSGADEHSYDWSPDSQYLVFGSARAGKGSSDLYIMSLTDGTIQQLTDDPLWDRDPKWSSDGKKIAFLSASNDGSEQFINLMFVDGREGLTIAVDEAVQLSWSPDSQLLAYGIDQNLYMRTDEGRSSTVNIPNLDGLTITWRP